MKTGTAFASRLSAQDEIGFDRISGSRARAAGLIVRGRLRPVAPELRVIAPPKLKGEAKYGI